MIKYLVLYFFTAGFLSFSPKAMETPSLSKDQQRIQELRSQLHNDSPRHKDSDIWKALLQIDPDMSALDLRLALNSFALKKIRLIEAWKSYMGSTSPGLIKTSPKKYRRFIDDLNINCFIALQRLFEIGADTLEQHEIEFYWKLSIRCESYPDAYQATILLADKFNIKLECLDSYQLAEVVNIFSYNKNVDAEKLKKLETYLISKGDSGLEHLVCLYSKQKMNEDLTNLLNSQFDKIINMEDFGSFFWDIMYSCLTCKNYGLTLKILKSYEKSNEKYLWKALTHTLRGDSTKKALMVTKWNKFIGKNQDKMTGEEKNLASFFILLLQKKIKESLLFLDKNHNTSLLLGCFIYLNEQTGACRDEIRWLKANYLANFKKFYNIEEFNNLDKAINFALGDCKVNE